MGRIIGIDLGTTFSAIAALDASGNPFIINNREGERITPSIVLFDNDQPIVGTTARDSAVSAPLDVVQFVKRQMGNPDWRFTTESGATFTAEEVSAFILKRLKEDAEHHLGEAVTDAVITVPAYFTDSQRQSTVDAGRIAGLNVRRIINEPTAAALAYGLGAAENSETVLVYDLGGGTFDVTVIQFSPSRVEVLAADGVRNLGGFDWDNRLMKLLAQRFMEMGGPDPNDDDEASQELRGKAEVLKKTLSTRDSATTFLASKGKKASIVVTRREFETLTADLTGDTIRVATHVLEDAGLDWSDLDKVLLVGGSTRMPAVIAAIRSKYGKAPSSELQPDEVVALGAAVQAGLVAREVPVAGLPVPFTKFNREVIDVTAHGLGTLAIDTDSEQLINSIIVPRNTAVPCSSTETYVTRKDRQPEIDLRITQGDDTDPEYVQILYRRPIRIPLYPAGAPIAITIGYDASGIVTVAVRDETTGKPLELPATFNAEQNLAKREVDAMVKKISAIAVR